MSYNSDNKLIAKNTLFLYIRSIIILLILLYTSRVILDVLGVEDYGIYNLVGGFIAMFSMISTTLASASQRFITFALGENDTEKVRTFFTTSVSLHIIIALMSMIFLEILGLYIIKNLLNIPPDRINAAIWVLHFSILTLSFNIVTIPFNALIIAHEKMNIFAYISLLEVILKLFVVFLVAKARFDRLVLYVVFVSLIAMLIMVIYILYSRRTFNEARNLSIDINKEIFKEMFAFSGWNFLGNGSLVLRNQGVDMILNVFYGVTINAAKGISNQVQNAVTMFVGNFVTALNPQLTKAIAAKDDKRRDFLIFQGSRLSFYLYCMFIIPLLIVVPKVLSLWLVVVPDYTVEFVRWLLIYSLFDSLSRLLIVSILANGNIRSYEIVVSSTKLFAMPLVYITLTYVFENPLASVWVNILLEIVCLIVRLVYMRKLLGFSSVNYVKEVIVKCLAIFTVAFITCFLINYCIGDHIFIFVPISLVACATIIFFFGIGNVEREWVISLVKNKIKG